MFSEFLLQMNSEHKTGGGHSLKGVGARELSIVEVMDTETHQWSTAAYVPCISNSLWRPTSYAGWTC